VLKAVLNVLQDEGYIIKSADSSLGYLTGSKEVNVGDKSPEIVKKVIMQVLLGPIVTSVISKSRGNSEMLDVTANISAFGKQTRVRVNFQRKAIDSSGNSQALGQVQDASFYQTFFSKVDKGMFISSENL